MAWPAVASQIYAGVADIAEHSVPNRLARPTHETKILTNVSGSCAASVDRIVVDSGGEALRDTVSLSRFFP